MSSQSIWTPQPPFFNPCCWHLTVEVHSYHISELFRCASISWFEVVSNFKWFILFQLAHLRALLDLNQLNFNWKGEAPTNLVSNQMPKWEQPLISARVPTQLVTSSFLRMITRYFPPKVQLDEVNLNFGGWRLLWSMVSTWSDCSVQWFFLDGAGTFYQDYTTKKSPNLFAP